MHRRLEVSAAEDRSRVRHRNATWVLGIFRRIGVSLFLHWRGQHPQHAKATLADFHEEMALEHQRRAFALVNSKQSSALESSRASRGLPSQILLTPHPKPSSLFFMNWEIWNGRAI